ncbi:MAG TPA: PAS domain S-box protein, partial [Spirochaetota bacterium]|nr:PAS domain S-box protein [Spirochaetota bacterium]
MKKNDNATTRLDKKSFNELRESEELFRNLAESTPMAILIYQDNKWMYANPSAERITGYTRQELAAMNFWDMVHPDFKQLVTERGKKRQAGENVISSYEFKIIT